MNSLSFYFLKWETHHTLESATKCLCRNIAGFVL